MKKRSMMAVALLAVSLSAQEFKIDLDSKNSWKKIDNYLGRLNIETQEVKGKKAVLVTFAKKDNKTDTEFLLTTPDYSVKGKKTITVTFQVMASKGLRKFNGGKGTHTPGIRWYDATGKEIEPMTRFILPDGNGEFQTFRQKAEVPSTAVVASLQIGFDNPNITDGQIFAISDIRITE